ncbi:MAG: 4Fe-4S binding protein [Candidatus Heimdallarchaeota archaeon]
MQKEVTSEDATFPQLRGKYSKNFSLLIFVIALVWVSYLSLYMLKDSISFFGFDLIGLLGRDLGGLIANTLIPTLILPTLLAGLTLFLLYRSPDDKEMLEKRRFGGYWKFSLTDNRFGNWLIKRRWFQWVLEFPNAVFFVLVMIFGIYGYGGYIYAKDSALINGATFLTWNLWWPGMIITFMFLGRVWCTVCPLGCIGEWAHRTHLPESVSTSGRIIRFAMAFFLGVGSALIVGITIGLFGGFTAEELMGTGAISTDLVQGIFDYLIFLASVPVVMLSRVFTTIVAGSGIIDTIVGIFWLLAIVFGLYVGAYFGYAIPEFTQAMVIGKPLKGDVDPKRKYPKRLTSMWITTGLFAGIMMFDFIVGMFVNPLFTALFIVILIGLSIILGLFYERRAFCMYVCPLGGLIGTYGMAGTIEVRNKDLDVCKLCTGKYCLRGRTETEVLDRKGKLTVPTWDSGYACPMEQFPMIMDRNLGCIMCTECFKSCPYDNITLNIRAPFVDTYNPKKRRFDQSGLAAVLVGLTLAVIMPSIPFVRTTLDSSIAGLTGIFGDAFIAQVITTFAWFLTAAFLLPIGLFFLVLLFTRNYVKDEKKKNVQDLFNLFSYSVIPVGLSLHFAFWVVRIFEHTPAVLSILADPFGGYFMNNAIYNGSTLALDNPIVFPIALAYLLNPLYLMGFHNIELGSLIPAEAGFAIRLISVLGGMAASIFATHRTLVLNLEHDEKDRLKILIPVVIWIVLFTFLGLYALSSQV